MALESRILEAAFTSLELRVLLQDTVEGKPRRVLHRILQGSDIGSPAILHKKLLALQKKRLSARLLDLENLQLETNYSYRCPPSRNPEEQNFLRSLPWQANS